MESPSSEPQDVAHEGASKTIPSAEVSLAIRILTIQCKWVVFRHLKEGLVQWHRIMTPRSHADTAVQTLDLSSPECSESADRDSGAEPTSSSQGTSEEAQVHDVASFTGTQSCRSTCSKTKGSKKEGTKMCRDPSKCKSRRQRGEKQKPAQPRECEFSNLNSKSTKSNSTCPKPKGSKQGRGG